MVGDVVDLRETLSWFETKPLFGWRVLVPRTKEQAGSLSARLRGYGAVPEEVPTISVEPPRNPQQMDKAVRGLVEGRYEWIAFTSVNAVKAVREKFEEYGLDARAFSGLKVAAVGDKTAAAIAAWGLRADLVPSGEQSAAGLLADWPPYDEVLDPINRVFLPRADIATENLVAGLIDLGWECDDVTAYRTVRAAPPPAPIRDAIKSGQVRRGGVHLVLDGAQPGRHRRQAAPVHGDRRDRAGHGQDRRGARPAGRRARPDARRSRCWSTRWPTSVPPAGRRCSRPASRSPGRPSASRPRAARRPPADVMRRVARATTSHDVRRRHASGVRATVPYDVRTHSREDGRHGLPVDPAAPAPAYPRAAPAGRRDHAGAAAAGAAGVRPGGLAEPQPISSMPGVVQHTRDSLRKAAAEAAEAGLGGVMLFGVPETKDATGSGALDPDGILNVAIADVVAEVGDALTVMSDLCLDEFTDHGHCGVLDADGRVDNDATLELYAEMALAQADAGVDMVGPSGMMDGQVGVIRAALDGAGPQRRRDPGLLREVRLGVLRPVPRGRRLLAGRATGGPTSRTPPTPSRACARRCSTSTEGADIVMVKPALAYLDVVRRVRDAVDVPVAAYNISGEYAMVEAAAANGWIDREPRSWRR